MSAIPKTMRHTNAHLLAMARDKQCLMVVPWVCNHNPATVVSAHSNWHDKGIGRKASDFYSVWACSSYHTWLDQGQSSGDDKRAMFDRAHERQIVEWKRLAYDGGGRIKDRDAALWALSYLKELK